jgi:hypothetical protein
MTGSSLFEIGSAGCELFPLSPSKNVPIKIGISIIFNYTMRVYFQINPALLLSLACS